MKLIEKYRQYGPKIFLRILKAGLNRIGFNWESFYLLKYTIDNDSIQSKLKLYNYNDVKELSWKDLQDYSDFNQDKLELYRKRYESEEYSCYGIIEDNRIVYSTWISWKSMNYPTSFNITDTLKDDEALLEDSYCHPDYRGKGFHSKMNIYRLYKISERGIDNVLGLVLVENTPALKVQYKSGFKIYKNITLRKKFGKTYFKIKDCYDDN